MKISLSFGILLTWALSLSACLFSHNQTIYPELGEGFCQYGAQAKYEQYPPTYSGDPYEYRAELQRLDEIIQPNFQPCIPISQQVNPSLYLQKLLFQSPSSLPTSWKLNTNTYYSIKTDTQWISLREFRVLQTISWNQEYPSLDTLKDYCLRIQGDSLWSLDCVQRTPVSLSYGWKIAPKSEGPPITVLDSHFVLENRKDSSLIHVHLREDSHHSCNVLLPLWINYTDSITPQPPNVVATANCLELSIYRFKEGQLRDSLIYSPLQNSLRGHWGDYAKFTDFQGHDTLWYKNQLFSLRSPNQYQEFSTLTPGLVLKDFQYSQQNNIYVYRNEQGQITDSNWIEKDSQSGIYPAKEYYWHRSGDSISQQFRGTDTCFQQMQSKGQVLQWQTANAQFFQAQGIRQGSTWTRRSQWHNQGQESLLSDSLWVEGQLNTWSSRVYSKQGDYIQIQGKAPHLGKIQWKWNRDTLQQKVKVYDSNHQGILLQQYQNSNPMTLICTEKP